MTTTSKQRARLLHNESTARALQFAKFAHWGQRRKFGDEMYVNHPWRVAIAVAGLPGATQEMVEAALLHDVLEDTEVTFQEILHHFGAPVANLVDALTDKYTPESCPEYPRKRRKELEAQRLASHPKVVRDIKRCDLADNTRDIERFDPGFAKVYRAEKDYIISLFDKADELC